MWQISVILSIILSIIYPILLLIGGVVCWRRSFKEGLIFFILMFIHEGILFSIKHGTFLMYLPTYADALLNISKTSAIVILFSGIYRRWRK